MVGFPRLVPAALAAGSLLALVVQPASALSAGASVLAAPTAGLTILTVGSATLEVDGGGNASYDPDDPVVVRGTLPLTTVTDVRTFGGDWSVSVSATAFSHGADASVQVPKAATRVYLDATSVSVLRTDLLGLGLTGSSVTAAVLVGDGGPTLASPYQLIAGKSGLLGGTIVFQPVMEVTIPAATPAGTYAAVVTQTVS